MRIVNVMAVSVDGRIAAQPDETDQTRRDYGFTNDDDRAHLKAQLEQADAVIVGRSSLMASGGAWELPNRAGRFPIWVIFSNAGLPPTARFFEQRRITRWLVSRAPLTLPERAAGTRNLVTGTASPAQLVVDELRAAGCERVLLFGGSEINKIFYEAGLVDELILTVCPLIVGTSGALPLVAPGLPQPRALTLTASHAQGNLVFLSYNVHKS